MTQRLALLFSLLVFFVSCSKKTEISDDSLYAPYIGAYSSGTLSRAATVRIVFQQGVVKEDAAQTLTADWLSISPSLEGELQWKEANVLEFVPSNYMSSGTSYTATLKLDALVNVPKELKTFTFAWRTYEQGLSVEVTGITAYSMESPDYQSLSGILHTNDLAEFELVEQTLSAEQGNARLNISWRHDGGANHYFVVDSVKRETSASSVVLSWDGKPIGAGDKGKLEQRIPGLDEFDVMHTRVVMEPEQHLVVVFSDPVDPRQELHGLFMLNGDSDLRIVKQANEVHLYPRYRIQGEVPLFIDGNVKGSYGYALGENFEASIAFESLKPAVRFVDTDKTLLPSGNKNTVAFEAVSLSAVDVRVIRIYNDNVHQFLQVNNLNGQSELKRVGRVIRRKTVELNGSGRNLAVWNRFYLDLDDLISQEPGAIYRVEINFRRYQSLYPCEQNAEEGDISLTANESWDSDGSEESTNWDYFDDYYYDYYWEDYDWQERDNPCHSSYYRQQRTEARNVFATDLAIIAKHGNSDWRIWVTNMMKASPVSGATVKWYNYQGQVLRTATTDSEGLAVWNGAEDQAFIVTAEQGKQMSFLKISSGESLSLARFDASGMASEDGMKGFVYGERGVWRPGDTLFLSFMLEDGGQKLPPNHPVALEIIDARGKNSYSQARTLGANQLVSWAVPTDENASTGSWQARVRVGNATFNQWLRIETIKPNRLKINLDFGDGRLVPANNILTGELSSEWLHGATAKNLDAQIDLALKPTTTKFEKYGEYTFDDPSRDLEVEDLTAFDGSLDERGRATVRIPMRELEEAPGMLRAVFNTRVYEPGGDFSIDVLSAEFSPFDTYVGVLMPKGDAQRGMLLTDTTHRITVQTVTANGQPAANQSLDYELYKVQWRWWWQSGDDDLSSYSGRSSMELINSGTLKTDAKGSGSFKLRVNYPEWGRYLVRVIDRNGGHACGKTVYIDWPGWAGRARGGDTGAETLLSVVSDREVYTPGSDAVITFPGANGARALVTVEDANAVIKSWWVSTVEGSNTVSVPIDGSYAPNVYVSVSLVQPHAQTENDHPMRLFGLVRLNVENPATRLQPQVKLPATLAPEQNYTVQVSEAGKRRMAYTLAVVDEGLLGLTRFKTPDPHGHFYAREALGVNTWDLYDHVIGAYGKALKGVLTTGGDESLEAAGKKKVNRFKPVVSFLGPFVLEPGATASHNLHMPNYVGSVRVMVVARDGDAYGNAEQTVPVKQPVMVLATLPRVVGPNEELTVPVSVFAMENDVKEVSVELKAGPHLKATATQSTVRFSKPGDDMVRFNLTSLAEEGDTWVEVTAKSGKHSARYKVEFTIRNPNLPVTERYTQTLEPGQSHAFDYVLPGTAGTNSAELEVSAFKPVNLGERLEYLIGYPHGCLEQTISRAFPQLYLESAVELTEQQKTRTRQYVDAAVKKVQGYSTAQGGFSYWPGQSNTNDWVSSYVGHFLLEAKAKGYVVPDRLIQSWVKYQDEQARTWRSEVSDDRYGDRSIAQAYRLYTLALAGKPNKAAMNRLREFRLLSETARWQLAAAYLLIGQNDAGDELLRRGAPNFDNAKYITYDYGSADRDRALIAHALVTAKRRTEAAPMIQQLSDRLNSERWLSTQETAFALAAIGSFMAAESGSNSSFDYALNGAAKQKQSLSKAAWVRNLDTKRIDGNRLTVTNTGSKTLYVQLSATGRPAEDRSQAASNGLKIDVSYLNPDGTPLNIAQLEQGTDFVAKVSVTTTGPLAGNRLDNLALTQVFPSGWEILNERMLEASGGGFEQSVHDYRDIRDDRVSSYFDLKRSETKTFYVRLNAAYLGRFFLPAANVEMMYDGTVNARNRGQWVEVVQGGVL